LTAHHGDDDHREQDGRKEHDTEPGVGQLAMTYAPEMPDIRHATVHDLPGVYRVCLLTGDAGKDATALARDPDLLGHVYVGPYVVGEPGLSLVVADDSGIAGYCLA